ncbi:hypothetical protein T01_16248 [Trichinella spiralis]|uniref:Uncharacterized protein n=1 Tax=Trichinella spiralis TaxID=6334 RepID=A0A0V1B7Z1_TRISP|nr:hypothetical protein T01_16248 [Trichinella spiralis]
MPEFQIYFNVVSDFCLLCLFAHNETSIDFPPSFTFPRQLNKKVNLISRYNFEVVATYALSLHGFPVLHLFPNKRSYFFICKFLSTVKQAVTMTSFIRPTCLIDSYINHTLTLETSSPSSPPRTSISGPNSVTHPYYLLTHSLSQSNYYKIAAGNVPLSCFL